MEKMEDHCPIIDGNAWIAQYDRAVTDPDSVDAGCNLSTRYKRVEHALMLGTNPNLQERGSGWTALHQMASVGRAPVKYYQHDVQLAQLLVRHKASVHVKNEYGRTPLVLGEYVECENAQLMQLLQETSDDYYESVSHPTS